MIKNHASKCVKFEIHSFSNFWDFNSFTLFVPTIVFGQKPIPLPLLSSPLYLYALMKINGHDFLHAVLDHLWSEEVLFAFLVHTDASEVLQEHRTNRFSWMGHIKRPIISTHLSKVWKGSTVIKVKVTGNNNIIINYCRWLHPPNYDAVDVFVEWLPAVGDVIEVRETSL